MQPNIEKAKTLLRKISYILDSLEEEASSVGTVERELLLEYIRALYDAVLFPRMDPASHTMQARVPVEEQPISVSKAPAAPPRPEPAPRPAAHVPTPDPVVSEPVATEPAVSTSPRTWIPDAHEKLFEFGVARELSEKLQQQPVKDLRSAFSLNDRTLTTNKLFNKDSDLFAKTIEDLNRLSSFEEAKAYLSRNLIDPLGWTEKDKFKTAKIFIKTVRRRYL